MRNKGKGGKSLISLLSDETSNEAEEMSEEPAKIDWSQMICPLPSNLFDQYTYRSLPPPVESLGITRSTWLECRSFALDLAKQGFTDPFSILYLAFKRLYPICPSVRSFSRWLSLVDDDKTSFEQRTSPVVFQSIGELHRLVQTLPKKELEQFPSSTIEQFWFLFSVSIRIPSTGNTLLSDSITLIENSSRSTHSSNKKTGATRVNILFAVTPGGRYSNQLIVYREGRFLKNTFSSSSFTRLVQTPTGEITHEHVQQWFDDFLQSSSFASNNSGLLIDPRSTLLTSQFRSSCEIHHIQMCTIESDYYLSHLLLPFFSIFDKQWMEANRTTNKMRLISTNNLQSIINALWFALRTLKQNEQISKIFHQTPLWRSADQQFIESLRPPPPPPKKRRKKLLLKTGSKGKLSSSQMMADPPMDATPEQIFSLILLRQLSLARASKHLGGIKLDYIKHCLASKSSLSSMTGARLVQLDLFMQSSSTVEWLRRLRALHFWPCAKQLFLREIFQLTGILTRKREMNNCGSIGTIRSCDQQSSNIFWQEFERIHQVKFNDESNIDDQQWHEDFRQYLIEHKLDQDKATLWTVDTFEFSLTKKSTILQLPEWNEQRPMNLTPKVTVVYAFSNDGQSTQPHFIFPNSLREKPNPSSSDENDQDTYNELGHLTPQVFLSWINTHLLQSDHSPMFLLCCSRLPVLSSLVLSSLESHQIYPFGYPHVRSLPFRYLFERRVRNNRSTNLLSELWKKKLLDEQRTHVLKGLLCSSKTIKYYFEQIWPYLINDQNDEGGEIEQQKTFPDKCRQAFEQANIRLLIDKDVSSNEIQEKKSAKNSPAKRNKKKKATNASLLSTQLAESNANNDEIVDELNALLTVIGQVKEQISSSQILKMKNAMHQSVENKADSLFQLALPNVDNVENVYPSSSSSAVASPPIENLTGDKRPSDENDEPRISKRLRSSCPTTTTTVIQSQKWLPPSRQLVTLLQSQSSSLFQFILSLIHTIFTSSDYSHLTDEHNRWLRSTLHICGYHHHIDKLNILIEMACNVATINTVR